MNGLYDAFCAIVLFPLIVYIGASGRTTDRLTAHLCKFLGDISYPLYMVHYPFIYLYYAWVKNEGLTFAQSLPGAAALVAGSVLLAYLCLKLYDEPVRRLLTRTVPAHTQVAARPQSPMPEPIEGKRSHWRYSPSTSS